MITTAPLPSWGQLLALRFLGHPDAAGLARPWLRPGDLGALWLARSAWSLAAIADAWTAERGRRPVIAVPEYICAASLAELRRRGEVVFFPVSARTVAAEAWPDCDIVLHVHTFGRPAPIAAARAHCDRSGALLVEDAAHVLRPCPEVGEAGDLVLYSPHKLLAVPDGAVMVVRPGARSLERRLGEAVRGLGWRHPPTGSWRVKRLLQKSPAGALLARLRPGGQPDFASDPAPGALGPPMPSPAGAALIARADLDAVAGARRANATALAEAVAPLAAWEPLFPLEPGWVPYRLVMRCADEATATEVYARLRRAGLPVESWPDLPAGVGHDGGAWRLRRTLLLLPCHQSLDAGTLAGAYRAVLGGE